MCLCSFGVLAVSGVVFSVFTLTMYVHKVYGDWWSGDRKTQKVTNTM